MAYIDKYGVEFSDDRKTLVRCPEDFQGGYVIPDDTTCIRDHAFHGCTSLTSLAFSNKITSIGDYAFCGCMVLISVSIPNSVTSIGQGAFYGCKSLISIIIPNSITQIESVLFYQCSGLISVKIPCSVTSISDYAFSDCTSLTSITIPDSVTSIGNGAFSGCSGLTSINIPNSVTCISAFSFAGCLGLTNLVVEDGNANYDSRENCKAIIETASNKLIVGCKNTIVPSDVTSIGNGAFSGCIGLTSITIPEGVTSIGINAFAGCSGLTSITIPSSVTSIGFAAFVGCSGLTSVAISDSVTSISGNAFDGCNSLTSPIYNQHLFVYFPKNHQGPYSIPDGIESISDGAFRDCTGLTCISIPDSVASIGRGAFLFCVRLRKIEIPNSVKSIGNDAFFGCIGLNSPVYNEHVFAYLPTSYRGEYTIPDGIESISAGAFRGCVGLTSINIPNSVKSIGYSAFRDCYSLNSVTIPNGVTSIGSIAFVGCSSMASISIPKSVVSIDVNVFGRKSEIKSIIVPNGERGRFAQMEGLLNLSHLIVERNNELGEHEAQEQLRLQEQQCQDMLQGSMLFFDTETTGVPRNYRAPVTDSYNWPRLVQLAWMMVDKDGNVLKQKSVIIKPDGFSIPFEASAVHGITTERAQREGLPLRDVLEELTTDLSFAAQVVGHNIDFDRHIVGAELYRLDMDYNDIMIKPSICTMKSSTDFCAIPSPNSYYCGYKWPSLQELYRKLFNRDFVDAHDALADITATKDCFFELKRIGII